MLAYIGSAGPASRARHVDGVRAHRQCRAVVQSLERELAHPTRKGAKRGRGTQVRAIELDRAAIFRFLAGGLENAQCRLVL